MRGRNLVSITDISPRELDDVLETAMGLNAEHPDVARALKEIPIAPPESDNPLRNTAETARGLFDELGDSEGVARSLVGSAVASAGSGPAGESRRLLADATPVTLPEDAVLQRVGSEVNITALFGLVDRLREAKRLLDGSVGGQLLVESWLVELAGSVRSKGVDG